MTTKSKFRARYRLGPRTPKSVTPLTKDELEGTNGEGTTAHVAPGYRPPTPTDRVIAGLRVAQLALGEGATGTIIFHVPDRSAYDAIRTDDGVSVGCEEHGVLAKGFVGDGLRVCFIYTDPSALRMRREPDRPDTAAMAAIMNPFRF